MVRHSAFTMIELIFAIVIIAISVMSLPMVNQVIAKNTERNMAQETIFAASAELNQIIAYRWDENSLDTNSYLSRVTWGDDCNATTKRRSGHINQLYHRRCTDNTIQSNFIGLEIWTGEDITTADDLDDLDGHSDDVYINYSSNSADIASGYKNNYVKTYSVSYQTIDPTNYSTAIANNNIKQITVTITNTNPDPDVLVTQLTTFSSNIGEIDYYRRTY